MDFNRLGINNQNLPQDLINRFQPRQQNISKPSSKSSEFNCRDGPTSKKAATDCQYTAIYFSLTFILIVTTILFQKHSIQKFDNPFNHNHQPCNNNQSILLTQEYPSTCVDNCPQNSKVPLKCDESVSPHLCYKSVNNLKYSSQLSICYKQGFFKEDLKIPTLIRIVRSVREHTDVIYVGVGFMLVYCGFLVFTNLIFTNSLVYVSLGITESIYMIFAGACFYKFSILKYEKVQTVNQFQLQNKFYFLVLGIAFSLMFSYGMFALYRKKGQLKYIIDILKLSKVMFLDNLYLVFLVLLQIIFIAGVLYIYLNLIYVELSFGYIDTKSTQPFEQFKFHPVLYFILPLSLFILIWTFSICMSSARFILNCITIEWYFNQNLKGQNYNRFTNLTQSLKLLYIHFGTICYSALLFFFPRVLFKFINFCKNRITFLGNLNCSISPCCRYLTIYSYTHVILKSYDFQKANKQCCSLLNKIREQSPRLYEVGDYFSRSVSWFFVIFIFGFSYYMISLKKDVGMSGFSSVLPSSMITIMFTYTSCTLLINLLGFVGDVIVMLRELDKEAQELPSQRVRGMSTPKGLENIFQEMDLQD